MLERLNNSANKTRALKKLLLAWINFRFVRTLSLAGTVGSSHRARVRRGMIWLRSRRHKGPPLEMVSPNAKGRDPQ